MGEEWKPMRKRMARRSDVSSLPEIAFPTTAARASVEMIVIGVSTGGPAALEQMLPRLPASLPVPVLIVQHMPRLFAGELVDRLNVLCAMPVRQARDGMKIQPGCVLLAPAEAHMEVARGVANANVIHLHDGVALNSCKPSVDYLFNSAARRVGAGTLALVMTGMGQDGLAGARAVHRAGGVVLAQDEASSAVWGMPGRVVEERLASACIPLCDLAEALIQRVTAGQPQCCSLCATGRSAEARAGAANLPARTASAAGLQHSEEPYGMQR